MRAAVTQAVGTMEVIDVPEPPEPGPGQVVVGSMAVGICGSDYHFFSGHLSEGAGGGPGGFRELQARERGADVLVIDPQESRLSLSREMGAQGLVWTNPDEVVAYAREWAGGEGVPVAVDATGVPQAVRAAVDMAASAGRVAQVGMSGEEVSLRVGSFTEKELDMLGVCCCGGSEFAEAVAAVERNSEMVRRLISHEFELERAPEAIDFAMSNPSDVMKVVIRGA